MVCYPIKCFLISSHGLLIQGCSSLIPILILSFWFQNSDIVVYVSCNTAIPNKNKKISSNTDSLYLLLYLIIILEKNKIEL